MVQVQCHTKKIMIKLLFNVLSKLLGTIKSPKIILKNYIKYNKYFSNTEYENCRR